MKTKSLREKLLSLCDTWIDTEKDLCITKEEYDLLKSDVEKMSVGEFNEEILTRRFGSAYVDAKKEFNKKAFKTKLAVIAQKRLKDFGKWED